jgi:hypothetical protein
MTEPPLLYSAATFLIGVMFLYIAVDAIRTGVHGMRGGSAYRDRHPIRFWFYVAMSSVFGAGGLVIGVIGLGMWAWRQFGPAARP